MPSEPDQRLKDMAEGAGLKLVKSRRRKPGLGDYGHYGLKTAEGQPCFGIEGETLTATPDEIVSYLRKRSAGRWRQSAATVMPTKRTGKTKPKVPERAEELPPPRKNPAGKQRATKEAKKRVLAPERKPLAHPKLEVEPQPEPELQIRTATDSDIPAITALVQQLKKDTPEQEIGRAVRSAKRKHEPPLVADRCGVIGCVAYHVIPTVQSGSIGRITLLVVEPAFQRKGIGTALLKEAEARLKKKRCKKFEIVNEIALQNASGFLRRCGYEDRAYLHRKG